MRGFKIKNHLVCIGHEKGAGAFMNTHVPTPFRLLIEIYSSLNQSECHCTFATFFHRFILATCLISEEKHFFRLHKSQVPIELTLPALICSRCEFLPIPCPSDRVSDMTSDTQAGKTFVVGLADDNIIFHVNVFRRGVSQTKTLHRVFYK